MIALVRFLLMAIVVAFMVLCESATAATRVNSTAEFNAAVERLGNRAGTLILGRGQYGLMSVTSRSARARWLTIRAEAGARVRWLEVHNAYRVKLQGLRFAPRYGKDAKLMISDSRYVVVDRLRMRGFPGRMARVRVYDSADVILRASEFSWCKVVCLRVDRSARFSLIGSHLHDCHGCDFLLVRGAVGMLLRNNSFKRALPGKCGIGGACNHQDLVQLTAGRDWLIEDNHFGLYYGGAAQLYLSGSDGTTDNVIIRRNSFDLEDPTVPGWQAANGIIVGNPSQWPGEPTRVVIEDNQILSGAPRLLSPPERDPWYGVSNSVIVSERYQHVPEELRPFVSGNTIAAKSHPELCDQNTQGGTCT